MFDYDKTLIALEEKEKQDLKRQAVGGKYNYGKKYRYEKK